MKLQRPRRCVGSWMAVTVPNHDPMMCPECGHKILVEDDKTGRDADQLIAHDVNGEPGRVHHA